MTYICFIEGCNSPHDSKHGLTNHVQNTQKGAHSAWTDRDAIRERVESEYADADSDHSDASDGDAGTPAEGSQGPPTSDVSQEPATEAPTLPNSGDSRGSEGDGQGPPTADVCDACGSPRYYDAERYAEILREKGHPADANVVAQYDRICADHLDQGTVYAYNV